MTSKRDPKGRDLGPVLALAGGALALGAVIAGFIVVGGPGDARARRLDEQTMASINGVASIARCIYSLEGTASASLDAMRASVNMAIQRSGDASVCHRYSLDTELAQAGVEYSRIDDSHIRLCGQFHQPYDPARTRLGRYSARGFEWFPELKAVRPAGRHCYHIELVKLPARDTN